MLALYPMFLLRAHYVVVAEADMCEEKLKRIIQFIENAVVVLAGAQIFVPIATPLRY